VYDGAGGSGHSGAYHIKGFAAFVVTGYNLPSGSLKDPSLVTGSNYCSGSNKCVYGFFTRSLVPAAAVVGGPDLGTAATQLTG
jgi:hypothetical protein